MARKGTSAVLLVVPSSNPGSHAADWSKLHLNLPNERRAPCGAVTTTDRSINSIPFPALSHFFSPPTISNQISLSLLRPSLRPQIDFSRPNHLPPLCFSRLIRSLLPWSFPVPISRRVNCVSCSRILSCRTWLRLYRPGMAMESHA